MSAAMCGARNFFEFQKILIGLFLWQQIQTLVNNAPHGQCGLLKVLNARASALLLLSSGK